MINWKQYFVCLLFYAISTVFQLYHGGDMMCDYEMRRRKPKHTLLPIQGIFNLPHHIVMAWEELAFDDVVSYAQSTMDCSTTKCYTPHPNRLSYLPILGQLRRKSALFINVVVRCIVYIYTCMCIYIVLVVPGFIPLFPGSPTMCINQLSYLPTPGITVI